MWSDLFNTLNLSRKQGPNQTEAIKAIALVP